MVCFIGSGRMASMARLLEAGSASQTITGEVGHWKVAAQYIHRELREADEVNLLDEEDMHIFDLEPMTDPLNLVCCNACMKPVKASQYSAHAELCKSLSSSDEIISELDGGTGHKKPPRKERKKLLTAYANQTAPVRDPERFGTVDGERIITSESHLKEQTQMTTSSAREAKRNSLCVGEPRIMDGSLISPGNTDYSTDVMPPPTKRSKSIAAESLLISAHIETAHGVTKSLCVNTQEALTCREYPNGSRAGSEKACDNVDGYLLPQKIHDSCLQTKGKSDVPAPLATKIFYSQRNHRLRSALSHLYHESSAKQHGHDLVNVKVLQGKKMPSRTSSPKNFCHEQIDDQQEKREKHSLPPVQKHDQILAQSSEVYLDKSGGCPPAMNFSNQFPVNNVLGPRRTPVGMIGSNYLSNPYSFAGNSGKPLGTLQQPKGSVPVV